MKKATSVALLILLLLGVSGCFGPKPVVVSQNVQPGQAGSDEPFRVEAVVANQGPGDGSVTVEVSLTNKRSGEVIAQKTEQVELQKDETEHVLFEINLPPSAKDLDPAQIDVQVEAHYPD